MIFRPIKLICCLAPLSIALLIGCGQKAPEQQVNQPESNPHSQPPATPDVEPTEATLFINIQRKGLTLAITGPWRR